jgi:hypothetical protein
MKRHILIARCTIVLSACCDYAAALVFKDGGTLTGILANGDILNNTFSLIHTGADITFIPEPGTILLLGLGGLGVLRKRDELARRSRE